MIENGVECDEIHAQVQERLTLRRDQCDPWGGVDGHLAEAMSQVRPLRTVTKAMK